MDDRPITNLSPRSITNVSQNNSDSRSPSHSYSPQNSNKFRSPPLSPSYNRNYESLFSPKHGTTNLNFSPSNRSVNLSLSPAPDMTRPQSTTSHHSTSTAATSTITISGENAREIHATLSYLETNNKSEIEQTIPDSLRSTLGAERFVDAITRELDNWKRSYNQQSDKDLPFSFGNADPQLRAELPGKSARFRKSEEHWRSNSISAQQSLLNTYHSAIWKELSSVFREEIFDKQALTLLQSIDNGQETDLPKLYLTNRSFGSEHTIRPEVGAAIEQIKTIDPNMLIVKLKTECEQLSKEALNRWSDSTHIDVVDTNELRKKEQEDRLDDKEAAKQSVSSQANTIAKDIKSLNDDALELYTEVVKASLLKVASSSAVNIVFDRASLEHSYGGSMGMLMPSEWVGSNTNAQPRFSDEIKNATSDNSLANNIESALQNKEIMVRLNIDATGHSMIKNTLKHEFAHIAGFNHDSSDGHVGSTGHFTNVQDFGKPFKGTDFPNLMFDAYFIETLLDVDLVLTPEKDDQSPLPDSDIVYG